jgi:hypothetical protein
LSNAVGGTVRQIAWLGVLVMFPCAVWLLRRRPHALLCGTLLYIFSVAFVIGSLHWFAKQPHSVSSPLLGGIPNRNQISRLFRELMSLCLSGALFLLPVLIAYVPKTPFRNRRIAAILLSSGVLWAAALSFLALYLHPLTLDLLLAPFLGNCVSAFGLMETTGIKGAPPVVLSLVPRLLISAVVLLAIVCLFVSLSTGRSTSRRTQTPVPTSWNCLFILLVPFTFVYFALVASQDLHAGSGDRTAIYDRYFLPLLPIALIFLVRVYQERIQPNLPLISCTFVLLFGAYAVSGTHDAFSKHRALQAAIKELKDAGVSGNAIDAGFGQNAIIQIQTAGYVVSPNSLVDAPEKRMPSPSFPTDCQPVWVWLTPAIVPGYALSYDPKACGGQSNFAPVTYSEWLLAQPVSIYIVNTVGPASAQR